MEQFEDIVEEICRCGYGPILRKISGSSRNPGWPYLTCPDPTETPGTKKRGCDYFEWVDNYKARKAKEESRMSSCNPMRVQRASYCPPDSSYQEETSRTTCPSCSEFAIELRHIRTILKEERMENKLMRCLLLAVIITFIGHLIYLSARL